ncbi:disease resistance protein RPP13-like [Magnolia sinica]|uniref:disease resistance protein RPP13-like n=1 Tax=Magnolia sinica TaxID=86752 RepID=UPI0026599824|nr:disease resistance protein RPP13-like [Magnolia sinica]
MGLTMFTASESLPRSLSKSSRANFWGVWEYHQATYIKIPDTTKHKLKREGFNPNFFLVIVRERRGKMAVAESVIELLLQNIGDPFSQEAISLHGVRDQVERLKEEFRQIPSFLEDADARQEGDEIMKRMQDVKDVARDAEDLIDTFVFNIATLRRIVFVGGSIQRYAFIFNELIVRRKVGFKIEQIKNKIREISEKRSVYGIENIGQGAGGISAGLRLTSPYDQESDFVGFENDLKVLVARLTEGETRRCAISIVGMGGLGKTTLAKKVHNTGVVKKHFDAHAWITVSQEYSVSELLQNIINRCMVFSKEELELKNVHELRHIISEHLKEKKYLMVLDDIWTVEAWDALKDAFPDMNNGSRVMLTTRNKDLALHADARNQPHELGLLNDKESWGLFCRKAFPGQDGNCPQYLKELGRKMVQKCHGLPLAIIAIGGLLSRTEPEPWEYEKVYKSISWNSTMNSVLRN